MNSYRIKLVAPRTAADPEADPEAEPALDFPGVTSFRCYTDDASHAIEQALSKHPGSRIVEVHDEDFTLMQCDNCGLQTDDEDELGQIRDLWGRVSPGEIMPIGECPRCECLVHVKEL